MDAKLYLIDELVNLFPRQPIYQMVDRAQIAADGSSATGIKAISLNEPFFCGHFPAQPILPGVLQIEAMNQLAQLALAASGRAGAELPRLNAMEKVKFRRPVVPGDMLSIQVEIADAEGGQFAVKAQVAVGDQVASEAELRLGYATPVIDRPLLATPHTQAGETAINIEGIMGAIPHRFPFLLIDRVYGLVPENGTELFVALKNVTVNEPIFANAGAGPRVLPNFLVPEIAAQAGCACVLSKPEHAGKIAYFMAIDSANFIKDITPGDQLVIEIAVTIVRDRFGKAEGNVYVGQEPAASCSLKFAIASN